ncbi:transcription elongation factor GreA [Bradyrhizobium hipponense]|uniref:Transcription elongation factor GreA n=1 Tax=Bradyrhizobium hipponense TaxID=2605638 RepID=A0A5S4YSU0_9BRAD|nr:transcription elongation factor GreA [Bradyrhizobium hipponense]TYO67450.1 transcription elongation factor GreA [Bradyrhizobium hipponense]
MNKAIEAPIERLPMTADGYASLQDELRHRIKIERPRIGERIQDAKADDTNLPENADYQAAKSEQELNETRIAELQDKLARAEVIDVSRLSGQTIKFGATVTLTDDDTRERRMWQIVGESEADARRGKISVFSPLARALIGKTKGALVEVITPGGARAYKIDKVEWR